MRSALVVVLVAIASISMPAQEAPVYRAGTEVVRLDVSVTQRGRPVPALTADDFIVTDNGVAQRVESVLASEVPLSVLLVLDTSASMDGEKLRQLTDAGHAVIELLRREDRVGVVEFSKQVAVGTAPTTDRALVGAAVDSLRSGGPTALRDAIFVALQLRPADETQPLLLVFSDGADTASWLTERETMAAVRRAGVTIHSVEIPEADRHAVTPRLLEEVASISGGRRWIAGSPRELRELFSRALDEMRARYVLSFSPEGVPREGWHDVKVSIRGRSVEVKTRPGYLVAPSFRP